MIRAGILHVPFSKGRHAPITAEDQARVVVGILQNPAIHAGKVYPLYGPVEYTYEEIAGVLSRTLGKPVEYKHISFDAMLGMLASSGRTVRKGIRHERYTANSMQPSRRSRAIRSRFSISEQSRSITTTVSLRAQTTSSSRSVGSRQLRSNSSSNNTEPPWREYRPVLLFKDR